jgi:hypothetical protein
MKNIKFLTLTIIMFLAVSVSQSSAQILPPDVGTEIELGGLTYECPYAVTAVATGTGNGAVNVYVPSTGLDLDLPPSFSTVINVSDPATSLSTGIVTAIVTIVGSVVSVQATPTLNNPNPPKITLRTGCHKIYFMPSSCQVFR